MNRKFLMCINNELILGGSQVPQMQFIDIASGMYFETGDHEY